MLTVKDGKTRARLSRGEFINHVYANSAPLRAADNIVMGNMHYASTIINRARACR